MKLTYCARQERSNRYGHPIVSRFGCGGPAIEMQRTGLVRGTEGNQGSGVRGQGAGGQAQLAFLNPDP